jgi:C4-dicarboxylate-specific signal transduction histidine kinase
VPAVHNDAAAPTPQRRFLSLGQWLFLLIALFLVTPLCLANLWGYFQSRRYLTAATVQNVRNVAALEASRVTLYAHNIEDRFVSALPAEHYLADLVRTLDGTQADARQRVRDALQAMQVKMSGLMPVEEMQIISPAGTLLVSTLEPDTAGASEITPACLQTSADGPVIAGFSHQGQDPSLLLASTVKGDQGERVGILCARFHFDIHQQLVQVGRKRTNLATLYLLNEQGEIVSASVEDSQHALFGQQFRSRGRTLPALDRSWEGRYMVDSKTETLAAYAPIGPLGGGVVVEIPVAQALADLHRLEWWDAVFAVALVLVVMVASVWSWRTVVYPLQSLSRSAERMAAGAAGETVTPGGSRETAELAGAFNRMSLALQESQHSLEQRISERTRELGESREFAELLLNSIDHRVIVVDRAYRIVRANAAAVRMYGTEIVNKPCYQVFEGLTEPRGDCAAARTFATGHTAKEERTQQTRNGREVVQLETYPILGRDGKVELVIEIGRIVTAEKQLQMQMMHQEKMATFGLLAAGVAHDIGNPLAAIESQLQLARQQPHRQEETLVIVSKEVARISRMLRELVDFSRRRRDALILVSANQVIEDVTRLLSHHPRARTVTITHRLAPNLPGVRTTEDHLFQVLFNLGLNGLDAMPGGGTLEFETCVRSGWVIVRVRDAGCGIPADLHEHLFEPFFTTKAPERGTGLGLFVSKSIVESMGGELKLEHTDNRGSIFAVFLPVNAGVSSAVSV